MTNEQTEERTCARCGKSRNAAIHEGLRGWQSHDFVTPAPSEEPKPDPCGFFCPATWDRLGFTPKNNLPPCTHAVGLHYSIDGENTGCADCEAMK